MNDIFPQAELAREQGARRYPASPPNEAVDFYYAAQTRDVVDEWTRVFSGRRDRLVRVRATQNGVATRIERTVSQDDVAARVDVPRRT